MAELNPRIEQFRKMAEDDPQNELGHFSLGRAYLEAEIWDGAIAAFERAISLDPQMSRAYQLQAEALLKKGQKDLAIDRLTQGVQVAHARGDLVPKDAMIRMLQQLGSPLPEMKEAEAPRITAEGQVMCVKCRQIGQKLAKPPFRNAQGQNIQAKVCQTCWREWLAMGTKVINELRLPLTDPQAQKVYDQYMIEFLNLG